METRILSRNHLEVLNSFLREKSYQEIHDFIDQVFQRVGITLTGGKAGSVLCKDWADRGRAKKLQGYFIDTDRTFPETWEALSAFKEIYDVQIRVLRASQEVIDKTHSWARNSQQVANCCDARKSSPLRDHDFSSDEISVLLNGRNTIESGRTNLPVLEIDGETGLLKVNPLANISQQEFQEATRAPGVVRNALEIPDNEGLFIPGNAGCVGCTKKVSQDEITGKNPQEIRDLVRFPDHPGLQFCQMHKVGGSVSLPEDIYERVFSTLRIPVPKNNMEMSLAVSEG